MRAFTALALSILASVPIAQATNLEEAQAEAAASGRLVLVGGSAEWCGPCRRFSAAPDAP